VTETIESNAAASGADAPKKRGGGLSSMLIADLKSMAGSMGIPGASTMKKAQLVEAIKSAQSGSASKPASKPATSPAADSADAGAATAKRSDAPKRTRRRTAPAVEQAPATPAAEQAPAAPAAEQAPAAREAQPAGDTREQNQGGQTRTRERGEQTRDRGEQTREDQNRGEQTRDRGDQNRGDQNRDRGEQARDRGDQNRGDQNRDRPDQNRDRADQNRDRGDQNRDRGDQNRADQNRTQVTQTGDRDDRNEDGSRRNRRRRGRDRTERQDRGDRTDRTDRGERSDRGGRPSTGGQRNEPDTTILEDDVLVPAAGILDVLDNYAFVRTSGYLPGSDDVYVSLSMVRKYGLRRGDAILGEVRQPREGETRAKFNPMVRIESVNGADPETAKHRVEFQKLTPLYASERLRLETEPTNLIGRVIDIAAPIGKGQRGLIVSPSKAGKTMIMQSIANSITTNNPECHLMVVLVDERPEEVTDFERSVKGEVISSTFDRPASDHTMVAELAIERAKRLVELGHDVVVLLDGITRLGRAYNLAAPASGRILSGGVDSAALYPPKRFFGAARNIENGGSLTILATALIESGSKMDEVIFEEFKGTGNMEIRLRRDFADKRIFPAIDAVQSGTRREELLMSKEELAVIWKLRRVLSGLDGQQALELLLERLKKSRSNMEFLMQVQKTTPTAGGKDD
jgi:transcription termination factor Rho